MAVFFGSWLCQMMHTFISLCVTVNKIPETVVINNHVRYSKNLYTDCCGVSVLGIIRLYFCEENNCTVTITSA
jgi:hypothetical protein